MKKKKNRLYEKFSNSQISKDITIRGGASDIVSYCMETTYVTIGNDIRHICDTTTSDEVAVGYTYP